MNWQSLLYLILLLLMVVDTQFSSILNASSESRICAGRRTLTSEAILSPRVISPKLDQHRRIYIASLGCAGQYHGQ